MESDMCKANESFNLLCFLATKKCYIFYTEWTPAIQDWFLQSKLSKNNSRFFLHSCKLWGRLVNSRIHWADMLGRYQEVWWHFLV